MNNSHVEVSGIVNASPREVYAVLSDYTVGHPAILPKPYFTRLVVKQGGRGEGTLIDVYMEVYGTRRVFHQAVSEPQPGRVLTESDPEAGVITSFTVEPAGYANSSRVTIATDSRLSPGIRGLVERLINPAILRRIYQQELAQLNSYMLRGL